MAAVVLLTGGDKSNPDENRFTPSTTAEAPPSTQSPEAEAYVRAEARNEKISAAVQKAYDKLLDFEGHGRPAQLGGSAYADFSFTYHYLSSNEGKPSRLMLHVTKGEEGELGGASDGTITVFGEGLVATTLQRGPEGVWETDVDAAVGQPSYEANLRTRFGAPTLGEAQEADKLALGVLRDAVAAITAEG